MMVNLSKQGREDLRRNRIQTGNEKRWKLQEDYLERKSLSVREWTVKGALTRLYGQGVQKLFASFPKNAGVAVAGSVAVAIYNPGQPQSLNHHPHLIQPQALQSSTKNSSSSRTVGFLPNSSGTSAPL